MRALTEAGIHFNGSGGGISREATEVTVEFFVGHKPRR